MLFPSNYLYLKCEPTMPLTCEQQKSSLSLLVKNSAGFIYDKKLFLNFISRNIDNNKSNV